MPSESNLLLAPALLAPLAGPIALTLLATLAGFAFAARRRVVRAIVIALVHSVYRIRVHGIEHLPSAGPTGGALLVSNHLSFVDALLIGVALPRDVRFLMHRSFFATPIVGRFATLFGALPIAAEDTPEAKAQALQHAADRIASGELVCIFAEGAISRNGALLPFARGLERIARAANERACGAECPIVPIALDRVFGSVFSYAGGRFFWKWPRRVPYPVDVEIGTPLAFDSERHRVHDAVAELIAVSRERRAPAMRSLGYRFVRSARKHARRTALVDSSGARLSYRELLREVLALRAVLARTLDRSDRVGIFLPPGADGVCANVALTLQGKTTVNLNALLGAQDLARLVERANLTSIVTSRRYLAALGRESPFPSHATLFLEDLRASVRASDRLRAASLALVPGPWLARVLDPVRDGRTPATVIFSSGSGGAPKGVVLSHANIASNVQAIAQVFAFAQDDGVLGVLPFFHSFGFTATLWTPLLCGGRGIYHSDPRDARTVGELCAREQATILLATPTFFLAYARRCTREELASLRLCVCGAEKLKPALADLWREKFEHELYEGYGCTELAPVVSVNVPDRDDLGGRAIGAKRGTVGRALPGVALRIVDRETLAVLPPEHEGVLCVRGPNVMQGYLGEPELSASVVHAGWYMTGDIGRIDRDAFLVITDRVARLRKLG